MAFTLFRSQIDHPAQVDRSTYTLRSGSVPIVTRGVEIAATTRHAPFAVTGSYTYVHAREFGHDVALTPRHRAGLTATAEAERHGRVGAEV